MVLLGVGMLSRFLWHRSRQPVVSSVGRTGVRFLFALALISGLVLATVAWLTPAVKADNSPALAGLSPDVDQSTGTFSSDVSIQVPAFHGLEPALKLHYTSTQINDWLGVGWQLIGPSSIQRTSPDGGTPAFGSSDTYYLDGQELVPDTSLGGNYSTKYQTYQRILLDSSQQTWTVWQKNGSKAVYKADFTTSKGTERWLVSSVSDPLGNTVTYGSWKDGSDNSYLQKISYNGTVITFYLESRPDPILRATGVGMAKVSYRLKTVDITTGGQPVRAYALKYTISTRTNRSVLSSVQQFGRDRTLDNNGAVTGGTSLPAITFGTTGTTVVAASATGLTSKAASSVKPQTVSPLAQQALLKTSTKKTSLAQQAALGVSPWGWVESPNEHVWLSGDFNGDGLSDLVYLTNNGGHVMANMAFAKGDGTYYTGGGIISNGGTPWNWIEDQTQVVWLVGDFNGDGRDDIAYIWNDNGYVKVYTAFSNGNGSFTSAVSLPAFGSARWGWNTPANRYWLTGDFNGDGKTDIAYVFNDNGLVDLLTMTSKGNGSYTTAGSYPAFGSSRWAFFTSISDRQLLTGDFTGDGKTDFAYLYNHNGSVAIDLAISTGNGQFKPTYFGTPWGWNSQWPWLTGNFNGDGKTDLAYLSNNNGNVAINTAFSNGDGNFVLHTVGGNGWPWDSTIANVDWQVGDINADGKSDIVYLHNNNGQAWAGVGFSNGDGTFSFHNGTVHDTAGGWVGWIATVNDRIWQSGDINGDLRSDVLFLYNYNGQVVIYPETSNGDGSFHPYNQTLGWATASASPQSIQLQPATSSTHAALSATLNMAASNATTTDDSEPDLLTQVNNGLGASTTVQYQPISAWSDLQVPVGFTTPTVASVTTSDGLGNSSTTSYSYSGARWDWTNHRFLGFQKVTATIDSQGTTLTTTFHQSNASLPGKADSTVLANASGQVYEQDNYTYSENGNAPYTSQLSKTRVLQFELGSTPRTIQTDYQYDQYGNTTSVIEEGDTAVSGDERTTATTYAYNTGSYLVNLPATVTVYAGVGTSGTQLSQKRSLYDGASDPSNAPTQGLLTAQQVWNDQDQSFLTTSYSYDQYGNLTQTTDPLNRVSTTSYDDTYHLYAVSQTNALNQSTSQQWDYQLGLPISTTDANLNTISTSYDALGRAIQTTDPSGAWISQTQYLNWGDPTQQHVRTIQNDGSDDGLWSDTYLDGLNRTWRIVKKGLDADHALYQDTSYQDASQNPNKQSLWYVAGDTPIWTSIAYDGEGRVLSTTYADGAQQRVVYGTGIQKVFDPLNDEKDTTTDGLGRLSSVVEWNGSNAQTTSYTYNLRDQLTQQTDALGTTTSYSWDSLGNKLQMVDPDLGTWSYTYNADNEPTSQTDAKGQTLTYSYDQLGRMTGVTYPDQSQITKTYDNGNIPNGIGRLSSVSYPAGSTQINGYDYAGDITGQTWTVGDTSETISSSYDLLHRLTGLTYPDQSQVSYGYDASGNLLSVSGYVSSMTYDAAGHLTGQSNTNGTSESFTYDANREWLTSASVANGDTPLYQASYTSDLAGRITQIASSTDTSLNVSYSYDPLSRLTQVSGAQSQSFSYDAVGNLTSNSQVGGYSYDDSAHKHAVTSAGNNTYSYDANGNLTSGAGRTLTWTYNNQPASLTQNGTTTTYAYDADGQRVSKTVNGQTTSYFGSLLQFDNTGLTKYIYAGERLVAQVQPTGATYWYHADHLGSVRLLTDGTGANAQTYSYDAFGQTINSTGNVSNPIGYGGHLLDSESGLIYMNARYYDPVLGRFLSADTAQPDQQSPQKLNRYSYASNNPINNVDPTGHDDSDYSGFSFSSSFNASGYNTAESFGGSSSLFSTSSLGSWTIGSSASSGTFGSSLNSSGSGFGLSNGSGTFGSGLPSSWLFSSFGTSSPASTSFFFSNSFSATASLSSVTSYGWLGSNSLTLSPVTDYAAAAAGSGQNGLSLGFASPNVLDLGSFAGLGYNPASQQDLTGLHASANASSSAHSLSSLTSSAAPDLNRVQDDQAQGDDSLARSIDAQEQSTQGVLFAGPGAAKATPDVYIGIIINHYSALSWNVPTITIGVTATSKAVEDQINWRAGLAFIAGLVANGGGDAIKGGGIPNILTRPSIYSILWKSLVGAGAAGASAMYGTNVHIGTVDVTYTGNGGKHINWTYSTTLPASWTGGK